MASKDTLCLSTSPTPSNNMELGLPTTLHTTSASIYRPHDMYFLLLSCLDVHGKQISLGWTYHSIDLLGALRSRNDPVRLWI